MKILTEQGEKIKRDYETLLADVPCACAMQFTCDKCHHPGNPKNIEKFDQYWIEAPADNIQRDMLIFFTDIQEKYGVRINTINCKWDIEIGGSATPIEVDFSGF